MLVIGWLTVVTIMKTNERRNDLERLLRSRMKYTIAELAERYKVSPRTIANDLNEIELELPLKRIRGGGGGVRAELLPGSFKHILTRDQEATLQELMEVANEQQKKHLGEILTLFGSPPKVRQHRNRQRELR